MKIALDIMGSDHPVGVTLEAAMRAVKRNPALELLLVGDNRLVDQAVQSHDRISVLHTEDFVTLTDKPSHALRHKQSSSMYLALSALARGDVDASVSCGNTGALMAMGRHQLGTLPGIDRPAIIKAIPSSHGACYLLDLGANIHCSAENLVQFARMGSLMCGAVENEKAPRVGLLNIGEEATKGGDQVQAAAKLLESSVDINYVGFVEGDAIYQTDVDVIVCDGWVGNIALKTSEGLARFVSDIIADAFNSGFFARMVRIAAAPLLKQLKQRLRPDKYNGASMLGLRGIVVKSHSKSSVEGVFQSLQSAIAEVEQNIPQLLESKLASIKTPGSVRVERENLQLGEGK